MKFKHTCMHFSHLILDHIPQLAWPVVCLLFFHFWIFWSIWPLCCVLGHFKDINMNKRSLKDYIRDMLTILWPNTSHNTCSYLLFLLGEVTHIKCLADRLKVADVINRIDHNTTALKEGKYKERSTTINWNADFFSQILYFKHNLSEIFNLMSVRSILYEN